MDTSDVFSLSILVLPLGLFLKSFVEFQLNMTDRELILEQILKKGKGSCKKSGKIYRSRGEFYAPKFVSRSFAARLWAANKDSAPENFTRYIQTHCKSRAICFAVLRPSELIASASRIGNGSGIQGLASVVKSVAYSVVKQESGRLL